MTAPQAARRPIKARSTAWAAALARFLTKRSLTPNQISCGSMLFALLAAVLILCPDWWQASLAAILCIQLRLLCNLMDGMVAVEGGKSSPTGVIYNEFPDRATDSMLIIALGYAVGQPWLGWLGALLAVGTAYVRVFGGSLGFAQDFGGITPKQRRMDILSGGLLLNIPETIYNGTHYALLLAAMLISAGSLSTCVTRTQAIILQLRARA